MSISQHQKQQLLNTLNAYLTGQDNVKKVINSGCLDKRGKMLSYDGTKVFTSNGKYRNNRFNPRGKGRKGGNQDDNQRRDNKDGKSKRNGGNKDSNKAGNSVSSFPYVSVP